VLFSADCVSYPDNAIEVENNTMPSLYQGAYMMSQGSSFKAAQFMGVVCAIVSG